MLPRDLWPSSDPDTDQQIEILVRDETELDPPVAVVVHNDDVTPMDFVVQVLTSIFGLPALQAARVMLQAHYNGRAVVVKLGQEEAKYRVGQAHAAARANGYPLSFTIEPE